MNPTPEEIARWLSPPLSAEDQLALDTWLEADDKNRVQWADWNRLWTLYPEIPLAEPGEPDKARVWGQIQAEMYPARVRKRPPVGWGTVAAAVAFLLLAAGWWQWQSTQPMEWTAAEGTTQVWLPDSSRVTLRKGARLTARGDFGQGLRQVHLEGEAFFEVRRDTTRAFVVQFGTGSLRVLGTSFLVQTFGNDSARAQVYTGKVAVYSTSPDTLYLLPGQLAALRGDWWEPLPVELASVAWATGVYRFQSVPLRDALNEIREAMGVAIHLERAEMGDCLLTATFEHEQPASMLAAIAVAFDMKITGDEKNGFTLMGGACAAL